MNELKGYVNHSGGALGADSYWGEIGSKYGVRSNHYWCGEKTPNGNFEITDVDYNEGRFEAAKAANFNYGYKYAAMKNNLLIRDWAQVKHSDAVFAVGRLAMTGSPKPYGYATKAVFVKHLEEMGYNVEEVDVKKCDILFTDDMSSTTGKMKTASELGKTIKEYGKI